MDRICRYEFMGNWLYFWFLCVTVVGIPLAVLYLMNGTIRVEDEVADAEQAATALRGAVK